MKKILITGSKGQLGKAINKELKDTNIEVINTDMKEMDITDYDEVSKTICELRPDIIINCAAYTKVESAEENIDLAFKINADGVKNIALAAKKTNAVLVHVSTDYIFDGKKESDYDEEDIPNPLSQYGLSKLKGESYVKDILDKYFIIRTAWLYGDGNNFVKTMINLSKKYKEVTVVDDQFGTPTSAKEVSKVIVTLLKTEKYGIYNVSCEGYCSWADLAEETFRLIGTNTSVKRVTSEEYDSKVSRPERAILSKEKLNNTFNYHIKEWKSALREYLIEGKYMKRKVLVTGANGYMGRHVVKALLDKGCEVIACDFNFTDVDKRAKRCNTMIFNDDEDLYYKLGEPDVVVHLAWRNGFVHNDDSHIDDLSAHYHFIKKMVDAKLPQLIIMGSMHEVGYYEGAIDENTPTNPTSLYGISKNALRECAYLLTQNSDTKLQWIRAYYIMGDDLKNNSIFSKLVEAVNNGKDFFPLNSGKNKYDFIMIEELANQISAVAMQDEIIGTINCCTGKPVSLGEKVEEFVKNNNFKIELRYGVFPDRPYDSPGVWGNADKINKILENERKGE